ncbi:MAG: DNA polymerase I [Armatimonadetes bacterium]|nr:MAG: DNA polymerase I [Armatimonadota bacterium]
MVGAKKRKKLVIIDGYSLLFRAFYGTRYMSTSDGRPTNALFGLVSMLFVLFEREKPDSIVVAFDAPGKTFRDEAYEEYKGTRSETPDDLKQQLPVARDLIAALGIPSIEVEGYEADDVIGAISLDAEKRGYETIIVSGDLDQLQLVDDAVRVMTTRRGVSDVVIYDVAAVRERFGFGPELVPDYKALVGDPSDNIPGVPGIGPKSATELLQKFGSVEEILARLDEVPEKYRKKIEPFKEEIPKYKWLATIQRDVPIEFSYPPYSVSEEQLHEARSVFESLEFRMHGRRLPEVLKPYLVGGQGDLFSVQMGGQTAEVDAKPARNAEEVIAWLNGQPCGLCVLEDEAAVAIGTEARTFSREVGEELVRRIPGQLRLHHGKSLLRKTACFERPAFDTLLAAYVLQSSRSNYDLEDLARGYLNESPDPSAAGAASAMDRLVEPLTKKLVEEEQWRVYDEIEAPLAPILAKMEHVGIKVHAKELEEFAEELADEIQRVEREIYAIAGEEFNIGSTQQLGAVLFEKLGLPPSKKTKTGYATGSEVLLQLAGDHEIARLVLRWRELTKLRSTYATSLPKLIAEDGRIHTTYEQHVAATGRLSSVEPNLQNIPIRTELGRTIRKAFVADEGFQLLSLDYSQIELRFLAHECHDPTLMDAFRTGKDVHAATASLMWNEPIDQVSPEHRRYAKMLNYAVLYGVTGYGLANQLGGEFSVKEAQQLIKQYFERFPKVREYIDRTLELARERGYTTTLFGRRRYFPDIHAGNRIARAYAERQAINAPLQGGSADLIKLAMIRIDEILHGKRTRMLLQVHDELLFEWDPKEDLVEELREAMETAMELDVPIEVDAKVGPNWLEMRPLERKVRA